MWLECNPAQNRCFVRVQENGRWPTWYQCQRTWKVEIEGLRYCTQHNPVKVKERQDANKAKYNAEFEARRKSCKRLVAEKLACIDVPLEMLNSGVLRRLIDYVFEMDAEHLIVGKP